MLTHDVRANLERERKLVADELQRIRERKPAKYVWWLKPKAIMNKEGTYVDILQRDPVANVTPQKDPESPTGFSFIQEKRGFKRIEWADLEGIVREQQAAVYRAAGESPPWDTEGGRRGRQGQ